MFSEPAKLGEKLGTVELPKNLRDWLAKLRLLKGVPFEYLVPDERILPPESIRFFYVDMNWVDALVDGAFSIGRNQTIQPSEPSLNQDKAVMPTVKTQVAAQVPEHRASALGLETPPASLEVVSGFLLRSAVVQDYKGIGVNAYPKGGTPPTTESPSVGQIDLLNVIRLEALGPGSDILLCLIDGDAVQIDVHESPEHLHYGIDSYHCDPGSKEIFASKKVRTFKRDADGASINLIGEGDLDLGDCFRPESPRVMKIFALSAKIAKASSFEGLNSAEMGFEMTQGVGKVSFVRKDS
ncbi:MAG: hypothetical protein KDM63_08920 [Verrucomicrobiae bacterium]|nr:hypothetical protein [Verrucomicrobiae bacterium]